MAVCTLMDCSISFLTGLCMKNKMQYKELSGGKDDARKDGARKGAAPEVIRLPFMVEAGLIAYYLLVLKIARNYGPVGWPSPGGAVMSLGILFSGVALFIMDKMKMILAPWYFIAVLMAVLIYFALYMHLYMDVS